MIGLKV